MVANLKTYLNRLFLLNKIKRHDLIEILSVIGIDSKQVIKLLALMFPHVFDSMKFYTVTGEEQELSFLEPQSDFEKLKILYVQKTGYEFPINHMSVPEFDKQM